MLQPRDILMRARGRKAARATYESRWQAIAEVMRPIREEFLGERGEGDQRGVRSYDGTAALALDQSGAGIYSMMIAPNNVWVEIEYADARLKHQRAARQWIDAINRILLMSLDPAASNFYNDVAELILDSISLGSGVFYSARPPGADYILDRTIPLAECCFDLDARGRPTFMDRWFREPLFNVADLFGEQALPPDLQRDLRIDPSKKVQILHSVYPNRDRGRDHGGPDGKAFASHYLLADSGHQLSVGGYERHPYFVSRWGVASGETYGRGRGEIAIPDAQMVNEMSRTSLVAAQRLAEPPIAANDELADLVSLDPNQINFGAIDDAGRQLIRPIELGGNIGITLEMTEQRRGAIREAFYHSMLTLVGSPTPSVVEILKRDERRDQQMGPNVARLISEFFAPYIAHRFAILLDAGQIPPPPPEIAAQPLRAKLISPLAKAHLAQKASATMSFIQGAAQIMQIQPETRHRVDGDAALAALHDGLAAPIGLMVDDDEYRRRMDAEQQQAQAAQALDAAEQGSRAADGFARAAAASRGAP